MDEFIINGRQYSWSDIKVLMFNRLVVGIKAINYKYNETLEDTMGQGSDPVGYTQGNYKAEASITLLMTEVEALRRKAPQGRITKIAPFKIVVAYLNEDQVPVKHSFLAKFTNDEAGGDNGSTSALEVKLDLKVIGIINLAA